MDQKKTSKPYSPEFRERAVRLFREHRAEYRSEVAALRALAEKLGCSPDSLRVWVRQAQRDAGESPGPTSAERARIKELERENRELRQANEILKKAIGVFCPGGARPPVSQMTDFIEEHREGFGVEPICKRAADRPVDVSINGPPSRGIPSAPRARAKTDAALRLEIDAGLRGEPGALRCPKGLAAACVARVSTSRAAPWSG